MAYPPTPPPNTRANLTPTHDDHPSDHNAIADALTDIINTLGNDPAGAAVSVQLRFEAIEADDWVTTPRILDGAVTADKILDGVISQDKAATGLRLPYVVADTTALAALAGMTAGDSAFVVADKLVRRYNGTAWKIETSQRGTGTLTWTASAQSAAVNVTFPVAYAANPIIVLTPVAITANTPFAPALTAVSTTGFSAIGRTALDSVSYTGTAFFNWVAMEAAL